MFTNLNSIESSSIETSTNNNEETNINVGSTTSNDNINEGTTIDDNTEAMITTRNYAILFIQNRCLFFFFSRDF